MQLGATIPANGVFNERHVDNLGELKYLVHTNISYEKTDFAESEGQNLLTALSSRADELALMYLLNSIVVDVDFRGVSTTSFASQLTLKDIAICSSSFAIPVQLLENVETGNLDVLVTQVVGKQRRFIPFSQTSPVTVKVKNGTAFTVEVWACVSNPNPTTKIAKIEKNVLLANQFTPVSNITGLAYLIIPKCRKVDISYVNGVSLPYEGSELEWSNNENNFIGVIGKNVCLSNFSESAMIPFAVPSVDQNGVEYLNPITSRVNIHSDGTGNEGTYYQVREFDLSSK